DRAFLAVGNRAHALRVNAARREIVAHRLRAPGAERDVVLARAPLVGMPFDSEGVLVVNLQPLRLLLQRRDRVRRKLRRIGFEDTARRTQPTARPRPAGGPAFCAWRILESAPAAGAGRPPAPAGCTIPGSVDTCARERDPTPRTASTPSNMAHECRAC